MTRPALVIGMGGTGQWVLTHLKRDLLEAGKGKMPDGVSLRSFDTLANPAAYIGAGRNHNVAARVGSVMLEKDVEYIYYGKNIKSMVKEIFNPGGPKATSPYRCQDWLTKSIPNFQDYQDDIFNVNVGAGALRQVGHLAFIEDIRQGTGSKVLTAINNAIAEITATKTIVAANANNPLVPQYSNVLEVIFVGSMAGGTGAGMMIDTALWCRHLLDAKFPKGATTYRAFLVAPNAFTQIGPGQDTEMMARSFAAWRELNLFQAVNANIGKGKVCYDANVPAMQIPLNQRLFGSTYIIDAGRTSNPVPAGEDPAVNLFPSIAQAIAAILDDTAGGAFTEQAINLVATQADHPTAHNVIGAFSIKKPIYHLLEEFTYQLDQKVWDGFLAPQLDNDGRCTDIRRDRNEEREAADTGRAAVIADLLRNQFAYNGVNISNSGFWKIVGTAARDNWVANPAHIHNTAEGFLQDELCALYCDSGIFDRIQLDAGEGVPALADYDRTERGQSLENWVASSLGIGQTPDEGFNRIPGECDGVIKNHYDPDSGTFIKILKPAGNVQAKIFADYFRALLEDNLNGHDTDPLIAKGGKLGWVENYLESLGEVLEEYKTYCEAVLNDANSQTNQELQVSITEAYDNYDDRNGDTHPITFWDKNVHPRAWDSERKYIAARKSDAFFQKNKALFLRHSTVAEEARKIIEATLKDLRSWKETLATGRAQGHRDGDQPVFIDGVYNRILAEQVTVHAEYAAAQRADVVSETLGNTPYQPVLAQSSAEIGQFNWHVSTQGDLGPNNAVIKPRKLDFSLDWGGNLLAKGFSQDAIDTDLELSRRKCAIQFAAMIDSGLASKVETELVKAYPNPYNLAAYILDKAEPWFRQAVGGGNPLYLQHPREAYLAVSSIADPTYFINLETRLNAISPINVHFEKKDFQDTFKLTMVRYDNVIESQDFQAYQECKDAYNQMFLAPGDLPRRNLEYYHIFPANVNAAGYERKIIDTLKLPFDTLEARTVALLDEDQKIELFYKGVALGFILLSPVIDKNGIPGMAWICQVNDTAPKIWLTTPNAAHGADIKTDYRQLITQFAYRGTDLSGTTNKIDYGILDTEIRISENTTIGITQYKNQYDLPPTPANRRLTVDKAIKEIRSIVSALIRDPETEIPKAIYPILAELAIDSERDLCHLGEVVLRTAANDPVPPTGHALLN